MSKSLFMYYAPELMLAMFLLFLLVGLIVGYFWWGSNREQAINSENENESLRNQLEELQLENRNLLEQYSFVEEA